MWKTEFSSRYLKASFYVYYRLFNSRQNVVLRQGSLKQNTCHIDGNEANLCGRPTSSLHTIPSFIQVNSRRLCQSFLAEALSAAVVVVSSCSSICLYTDICFSCFFVDKALTGEAATLLFQCVESDGSILRYMALTSSSIFSGLTPVKKLLNRNLLTARRIISFSELRMT